MAEKNPRLIALFNELKAEKEKLLEIIRPARETYERMINDPELVKARKTLKEYNPKLAAIDIELAGLAKALGGKRIKLETGQFTTVKE